jgi:hypothetical protein
MPAPSALSSPVGVFEFLAGSTCLVGCVSAIESEGAVVPIASTSTPVAGRLLFDPDDCLE